MIMTDNRRASTTRGAVRGDERGGIDFKRARRIRRHIGARARFRHMIFDAEQQPAHLARGFGGHMRQQLSQRGA